MHIKNLLLFISNNHHLQHSLPHSLTCSPIPQQRPASTAHCHLQQAKPAAHSCWPAAAAAAAAAER
jgi:hypothetical protein